MLDTRRLRVLVELSRRGTLSAVADALSYSRAAVSQQLSALEKEVGARLLVPAGRGVHLTPQAEILVAHAVDVLDRLENAEVAVSQSLGAAVGTIRVAALQSTMHAVIPDALAILAAEQPALRVEVVEYEPEHGLAAVLAREVDLAIAEQYPGRARRPRLDLDLVPLAADPISLALAPGSPVFDDPVETLLSTRDRPWVLEPQGTVTREWAEQLCRAAGFEPDVRFETADLTAHAKLIATGHAVGILPEMLSTQVAPTLLLSALPGAPVRDVFSSARLSSAQAPAIQAFRDALSRSASRPGQAR
ncbi:MAG: LysR substrate-binding domain-containing protein [Microbacterium sp.]|uniref:LysR substrate-binding domain-containing protein n=1 Tax=Microbacterium sp. TaxID=51671 RepID=UPI0039E50A3E